MGGTLASAASQNSSQDPREVTDQILSAGSCSELGQLDAGGSRWPGGQGLGEDLPPPSRGPRGGWACRGCTHSPEHGGAAGQSRCGVWEGGLCHVQAGWAHAAHHQQQGPSPSQVACSPHLWTHEQGSETTPRPDGKSPSVRRACVPARVCTCVCVRGGSREDAGGVSGRPPHPTLAVLAPKPALDIGDGRGHGGCDRAGPGDRIQVLVMSRSRQAVGWGQNSPQCLCARQGESGSPGPAPQGRGGLVSHCGCRRDKAMPWSPPTQALLVGARGLFFCTRD